MSCDSIFLNTCAQMYCLCVATQIKRCHQFVQNAAMLIFSLIFVSQRLCCLLFISCSLQESLLCSSCAQIDPVAVTCNESLALSITSVQLDKTLYFQHISPITSNTEKKRKRKKKRKGLFSSVCIISGAASSNNRMSPSTYISIFISTQRVKWIIYWPDNPHPSLPTFMLHVAGEKKRNDPDFLRESNSKRHLDFKSRAARSSRLLSSPHSHFNKYTLPDSQFSQTVLNWSQLFSFYYKKCLIYGQWLLKTYQITILDIGQQKN